MLWAWYRAESSRRAVASRWPLAVAAAAALGDAATPAASFDQEQVAHSAPPRAALPCSLPPDQRLAQLDAAARGVLAETALHGRQRYEWRLLLPLLHALVDVVLKEYAPPEDEVRAGCGS